MANTPKTPLVSHYEINIAKLRETDPFGERCDHYARVVLGNVRSEPDAMAVFSDTLKRYPHSEGWRCQLYAIHAQTKNEVRL